MTELNVINNKVIILDCDKVYDIGVGKMIKTFDSKFVSKKVIKDKKYKLFWRHIFSFLNCESIELINQYIYKYKMKVEVLGIRTYISVFEKIEWEVNRIVNEVYDCGVVYRNELTNNEFNTLRREKRMIREKEEWVIVEKFEFNVFGEDSVYDRKSFSGKSNRKIKEYVLDTNKQSKKLHKTLHIGNNTYNMEDICMGLLGNGDICGSGYTGYDKIGIDYSYYNRSINKLNYDEMINEKNGMYNHKSRHRKKLLEECVDFDLCGIHIKQYRRMNTIKRMEYVDKCYKKIGYEKQNGVLCKICK